MIRILRSKDNQFYYVVVSKNGKVLATSETYSRKSNCHDGAKAVAKVLRGSFEIEDQS